MFTHVKAAEAWLATSKRLPINVKFVIEGEEEVGGASLEAYVAEQKKRLACDYAVISDSSQFAPGQPAITYGLKGLAYFELSIKGANRDLHSGTYGGAVENPLNALASILASLKGSDGRIQIAGFYDDVRPLADWERTEFAALPFSDAEFQADLGVPSLAGESGYTTLERKWARPTCDVNGLFGGYSGPGPKTVLPCAAGAKFSFRLVPNQDPRTVERQLRDHVAKVCPPGVTHEILTHHGAPAVLVSIDTPGVRAAVRAVEKAFGKKPVFIREGGSIPIVGLIKQQLGVDTLLLGWGQNDDNLHGPNEKFSLADFHRGIKASAHLLHELATESDGERRRA
jgi:acetylornithine deacetylase/succinyl-diaminopimelate desuccinylase-like protein